MKYYSPTTKGFYSKDIHGDNMPSDIFEVSEVDYDLLIEGQTNGLVIHYDGKKLVSVTAESLMTAEQLQQKAEAETERLKDEAKKAGKPYTLNGVEYIVPLDKDAQDTVTAITVANIAGLFVSTTMEFSNGVKMPIKASEWTAFVQWFVTERGKFFS